MKEQLLSMEINQLYICILQIHKKQKHISIQMDQLENIYVDGIGASLMQWVYRNLPYNRAICNEGIAEIRGAEAIALYMSDNSPFHIGHTAYIKNQLNY